MPSINDRYHNNNKISNISNKKQFIERKLHEITKVVKNEKKKMN